MKPQFEARRSTVVTGLLAVLALSPCATQNAAAASLRPGDVLVGELAGGNIYELNFLAQQASTNLPPLWSGFNAPTGIAFAPDGGIIVLDAPNTILRIDPQSGARTVVYSGGLSLNLFGVAVATNGDILATADDTIGPASAGGWVIRIDAATLTPRVFSAGGYFIDPLGITVASDGTIYVVDVYAQGGAVIRVDPQSGAQTIVSSGGSFVTPIGVCVGPDGNLLVADRHGLEASGSVIRVNPMTGNQTVVSSGGNFVDPYGISVAANGEIFVADFQGLGGTGVVIRVDPLTGAQTVVSAGAGFIDPISIAVVPTPPVKDSDGDGVPDDIDECPDTAPGSVVDAHGCSLAQLVPCEGISGNGWMSHREYLSAVTKAAKGFLKAGLITKPQLSAILRDAKNSNCGKAK